MIDIAFDPISYTLWAVVLGILWKQEHRITKLEYALAENLKMWNNDIIRKVV